MLLLNSISPASGQLTNLFSSDTSSQPQSSIKYERVGNIDLAFVSLDGLPIFKVAAPHFSDSDSFNGILPIEHRVREIENHLQKIVDAGINPTLLQIYSSTLNNQRVIIARHQETLMTRKILTITEPDTFIAFKTEADLSEIRINEIQKALQKAWDERQPETIKQKQISALVLLLLTILTSLILWTQQNRLRRKRDKLKKRLQNSLANNAEDSGVLETQRKSKSLLGKLFNPIISLYNWALSKLPNSIQVKQKAIFGAMRSKTGKILIGHLPHLNLSQQLNITRFFRTLFWWTQVVLWLCGFGLIFFLFPETRKIALWLLQVPAELLGVFLVVGLGRRFVDIVFHNLLKEWAERQMRIPETAQRIICRLPTINQALQEITATSAFLIAFFLFLYWANAPIVPIITSLGLIGFAGQSMIKDWLRGCLILWEDQYAMGDVVSINSNIGIVEYMNLRMTQLRTPDGELVTIDHSSFTQVKNLTNKWSRVNLGIEIAYNSDLDQSIAVIQDVALDMHNDPLWSQFIIEHPVVLGVDQFGDNSITIRVWIKTQPLKQWDVAREYRRRLKSAFDQAGISIPFPQRSIWFENPLKV